LIDLLFLEYPMYSTSPGLIAPFTGAANAKGTFECSFHHSRTKYTNLFIDLELSL